MSDTFASYDQMLVVHRKKSRPIDIVSGKALYIMEAFPPRFHSDFDSTINGTCGYLVPEVSIGLKKFCSPGFFDIPNVF
ncbi:MAG: hypothetical protein ABFS45_25290 [Pseudomonadota bacterium]